jgi:hypothetical protein
MQDEPEEHGYSCHHHLPRMQQRARGGFYMVFQRGQRHLPRMQQRAGGGFYMAFRTVDRKRGHIDYLVVKTHFR